MTKHKIFKRNKRPAEQTDSRHRRQFIPTVRLWVGRHLKTSIVIGVVLVLAIACAIYFLFGRNAQNADMSANPIIANYQQQLPSLAKEAENNPEDSSAQQKYAEALYATGDYQNAKKYYESAERNNDKDSTLQNNLGNTYREVGEYEKAIAAYQEAIKLNPKAVNPYINLANVYSYTLNQRDLGIQTYQEALKNLPNNEEIEVLLGIAYEESGDKATAKSTFENILSRNASNKAAQAGLERVQR